MVSPVQGSRVVESVLGLGRSVLRGLGMLGSVSVISQLVTVVVLMPGLPVLLVKPAGQRASRDIHPAQRREVLYGEPPGAGGRRTRSG
ncbi:hypothetical protein [Nonomuraea sp. JJY05]|uniref:hypothetical protein n=1 Tax=Nonomuraea sp. JJY05 TaxID=3350255 RepID=UPI00373F66F4